MNLVIKNFLIILILIILSVFSISIYKYYNIKMCDKAGTYNIVLKCVQEVITDNRDKINYLNNKINILNNIDLFEQKKISDTYALISVYMGLIIYMDINDINNLINILKNNLDNDFALSSYLKIVDLKKEDKLKITKEYLDKNGILSKYEKCSYNYVYSTSYFYTDDNEIIKGYTAPKCIK